MASQRGAEVVRFPLASPVPSRAQAGGTVLGLPAAPLAQPCALLPLLLTPSPP